MCIGCKKMSDKSDSKRSTHYTFIFYNFNNLVSLKKDGSYMAFITTVDKIGKK